MNPRCSYTPAIDALRHEQRESVLASVQESSLPLDSSYLRAWFYIYCYGSLLLLIIYNILFQTSEQIFERKFVTKSDCCWLVDTAGFQMPKKSPEHLKLLCLLRDCKIVKNAQTLPLSLILSDWGNFASFGITAQETGWLQ